MKERQPLAAFGDGQRHGGGGGRGGLGSSHRSLRCFTGEMAVAPFPLSSPTRLEYLLWCPRAEACMALVLTSASLRGLRSARVSVSCLLCFKVL